MPQDTQQSFLAYYERKGKATPGPDEHYKELSWVKRSSNFGKGSDRKTVFDDAAERAKKVPGPEQYELDEVFAHVPLGKME